MTPSHKYDWVSYPAARTGSGHKTEKGKDMYTFTVTNRVRTIIVVGAIVAVAAAIGIGWSLASGTGTGTGQTGAAPGHTASATPTAQAAATPAPGSPGPAGGPAGGGSRTAEPEPEPSPSGPQIVVFRVVQEPRCPGGTIEVPVEGRPVVLEWRVTGAGTVTLSVDGPGIYGEYPAEGTETFSFGCGGEPGEIEQHTYLLTATGGGGSVTEELVVEAEVDEVTPV